MIHLMMIRHQRESRVIVPISVIPSVQQLAPGQVLSVSVVPVKIQHKNSNKEIITFVMLGICSQGTFTTENLMNQLGINGIQTLIGHRK